MFVLHQQPLLKRTTGQPDPIYSFNFNCSQLKHGQSLCNSAKAGPPRTQEQRYNAQAPNSRNCGKPFAAASSRPRLCRASSRRGIFQGMVNLNLFF